MVLWGIFWCGFFWWLFLLVIAVKVPTLLSLVLFLSAGTKVKAGFGMPKSNTIQMIVFIY